MQNVLERTSNMKSVFEKDMQIERANPLAPPKNIELNFWGTRGSIPVSGQKYIKYGGNTSCVSLTSDTGHLFIFDSGSGMRNLGNYLLSNEWLNKTSENNVKGYILLSHTHWDHIQGFPFFGPVFKPDNKFNVMGWSNGTQNLAKLMGRQMEQNYFPVSLGALAAQLVFYSLKPGIFNLDGAIITTKILKHTLPSMAYRVDLNGMSMVYATDHEPLRLPDPRPDALLGDDVIDATLVKMAQNADMLIHDAQYSAAEMNDKVGWGHSSVEVAVDTAIKANVKCLVLYHHDPAHDDEAIDGLLQVGRERAALLGSNLKVIAAGDGLKLEI